MNKNQILNKLKEISTWESLYCRPNEAYQTHLVFEFDDGNRITYLEGNWNERNHSRFLINGNPVSMKQIIRNMELYISYENKLN